MTKINYRLLTDKELSEHYENLRDALRARFHKLDIEFAEPRPRVTSEFREGSFEAFGVKDGKIIGSDGNTEWVDHIITGDLSAILHAYQRPGFMTRGEKAIQSWVSSSYSMSKRACRVGNRIEDIQSHVDGVSRFIYEEGSATLLLENWVCHQDVDYHLVKTALEKGEVFVRARVGDNNADEAFGPTDQPGVYFFARAEHAANLEDLEEIQ